MRRYSTPINTHTHVRISGESARSPPTLSASAHREHARISGAEKGPSYDSTIMHTMHIALYILSDLGAKIAEFLDGA
jgi:hypothetical protein